jgi:hypothetical protein
VVSVVVDEAAQADAARAHPLPGLKAQLLQLLLVEAAAVLLVVEVAAAPVRQTPDLKCRAWRSSNCCWLPALIRIRN